MDALSLRALNRELRARRAALILTDLSEGTSRLVRERDVIESELGDAARRAFRTGISAVVDVGDRSYFLNVRVPRIRLLIIGAVHISQSLAPMARIAGFETQIIDPRTAYATAERFPGIVVHQEWPEEVFDRQPLDGYTAVAALSHTPRIDDPALLAAIASNCLYVGALGSRKSHAQRVDRLVALGATRENVARIHAPIGLAIGAASPAEIAVSILAQLVETLRARSAIAEVDSRQQNDEPPVVEAVVLAAGRSSRMGGHNKLLADFGGETLVHRVVRRTLESGVSRILVVVGHQADAVRAALADMNVEFVENANFQTGLSSSLKAGVASLSPEASGAAIVLADMPEIRGSDLSRLIQAFTENGCRAVVRASHDGRAGNPVILPRSMFPELAALEGDAGARVIVESRSIPVIDVDVGAGARVDVDTTEQISAMGGIVAG